MFLNGGATPSEQQAFLYDNGQIVLEFKKTGGGSLATANLANRYLWGPAVDQLLADEDVNSLTDAGQNQVRWPLTDHLGTPRDWIDSSGALLDHAEYDAFGRRLDTDAIDAAFEWTARYRDPLTGLQYNNARWYNPSLQRWMSEDPIGFGGGDANLRRYVGNSPTMYVDPSGLYEEEPWYNDSGWDWLNPWAWNFPIGQRSIMEYVSTRSIKQKTAEMEGALNRRQAKFACEHPPRATVPTLRRCSPWVGRAASCRQSSLRLRQ